MDSKDTEGRTPLSFAAQMGHEAVVKLLLVRDDVEVNSKDTAGRTPVLFAAENGHETVVKLLMQDNLDSKDVQAPLSLSSAGGNGDAGACVG